MGRLLVLGGLDCKEVSALGAMGKEAKCAETEVMNTLNGLQVVTSEHMTDGLKWEFPYDRFVEYGKEDEWWAIKIGFGK